MNKVYSESGYTALRCFINNDKEAQLRINDNCNAAIAIRNGNDWSDYAVVLSSKDTGIVKGILYDGTASATYSTVLCTKSTKQGQLNIACAINAQAAWSESVLMRSEIIPAAETFFCLSSQSNGKSYDCALKTTGEIVLYTRGNALDGGDWLRGGCTFIQA